MGLLFKGLTISNFIVLILYVVVLLGINEITRRSKKASIGVYCILPVVLAILVLTDVLGSPTGETWFGWVKVVSALTGVYGFMLIRFTKLGKNKFAVIFPVAILALNISEAVFREFEVFATYTTQVVDPSGSLIVGGTWNILNGISGILCIVTLTGFAFIRVSDDKFRDMVWADMTWIYIVAYTLWNFAYVYNCISIRCMYAGFGILLAALIAELFFKQGVWLQHRAQILSVYVMFSLSVDYQSVDAFRIIPTYTEGGLMTISTIAFIFNVGALIYMIYSSVKYKRNPLKQEININTKYYKKSLQDNNLA